MAQLACQRANRCNNWQTCALDGVAHVGDQAAHRGEQVVHGLCQACGGAYVLHYAQHCAGDGCHGIAEGRGQAGYRGAGDDVTRGVAHIGDQLTHATNQVASQVCHGADGAQLRAKGLYQTASFSNGMACMHEQAFCASQRGANGVFSCSQLTKACANAHCQRIYAITQFGEYGRDTMAFGQECGCQQPIGYTTQIGKCGGKRTNTRGSFLYGVFYRRKSSRCRLCRKAGICSWICACSGASPCARVCGGGTACIAHGCFDRSIAAACSKTQNQAGNRYHLDSFPPGRLVRKFAHD